ncbi:hypothetical protein E2C01_056905 [Portunus trituberculatus]|uniref:Uncharacterized protein n=1 Tax=Portunus trituberculatus TaxID=210409 RepID=A0A5B7GZH6_PORTR|nr:hypothetical protein [Portunus trituberculatus]
MNNFKELLKKPSGRSVYYDDQQQVKFCQAQDTICQLAKDNLVYYDKTHPMTTITDWSRFMILQQYCHCSSTVALFCCKAGWCLALCGHLRGWLCHSGRRNISHDVVPLEGQAEMNEPHLHN